MTYRLSPLDFAVCAAFVLLLLGLGFSAKMRDNSVLRFIAAGRALTLPVFVATLVSTWYGGILGVGESVAYFGLGAWVLMGLPYYVFGLLYAWFLATRVRGADQVSLPERLESRYGRRIALLGAGLVFLLAIPAAHVLMLGVLVQSVTGWAQPICIGLGALVGTAFLYRGGLLADARASILAFLMMYVGFGAIVGYCLSHYNLGTAIASLEPHQRSWDGGMGVPFVMSFFILGVWTLVDPGFHQRAASAASPSIARRGIFISVGCWAIFDLLSVTTGIYALHLLRTMPEDPLHIYPAFGDQVLPAGLKAVFLCGMVGTIVSAMVGYTLVAGATLARDLYARARHIPQNDERISGWTRIGFAISTLAAIALALVIPSVVALWYAWAGAVVGALLLPVIAAYVDRWQLSGVWVGWATGLAFVVSIGWLAYGLANDNPWLVASLPNGQEVAVGTLLPGLIVSAIVLGVGRRAARRPT